MQDYVVGFRIFEGRSLQSQDGAPCDPFVLIECCGYSYQTETLERRSSLCPWNEHCTWPRIGLYPKEFESSFIEFKVYARNWFTRNFLIGKASLQLSFVNKRQHHLYARRWLPLRRDDSPAVTGTINVTIFVLKPFELAPSLSLQTSEQVEAGEEAAASQADHEGLESAVLTQSVDAQAGRAHYVRLNMFRVEELQDNAGAPSPYVTVEFAGCLVKTSTGKQVRQYTFNECLQIPVVTPVYEDTIILKLWSCNWFSPDELLAQGLLSFSELRSHALPPRWFNLYGWDADELAELQLSSGGDKEPEAHVFKGRLLVSGSVEPLDADEELQPQKSLPARFELEPAMVQLSIMADVYMVTGAEARQCQVEVSFGSVKGSTKWVSYDAAPMDDPSEGTDTFADEKDEGETLGFKTFSFNEKSGRVETLVAMTAEAEDSQPSVTISLYTSGYLQSSRRVAFANVRITDFFRGSPSEAVKPVSIPLHPLLNSNAGASASVLVSLRSTFQNADSRSLRKPVKPMVYLLRAYCFTARQIQHSSIRRDIMAGKFGVTVACTGMSRRTEAIAGPRPMWMQAVELKILLCSDSTREPPATEPISVSLWQEGQVRNLELGKAVCVYSHMRRKDDAGRWEPYILKPQWIKLFGDQNGSRCVGEMLVAFELLLYKHRHEPSLGPRDMWPHPSESFDERHHICRLRRATIHFSLRGLRDILPLPRVESLGSAAGTVHASRPVVTVEVGSFSSPLSKAASPKPGKQHAKDKIEFKFSEVAATMERAKRLKPWTTKIMALNTEGKNFDFCTAGKLQCLLPEKAPFEPYLVIHVYEPPSSVGASVGYESYHIGDVLVSLQDRRPCCWLDGVSLSKPYDAQQDRITKLLREARQQLAAKDKFQQQSLDDLRKGIEEWRQQVHKGLKTEVRDEVQEAGFIDPAGVPQPLKSSLAVKRPVPAIPCQSLNMRKEISFSPRQGARVKEAGSRKSVSGSLENSAPFDSCFWYRSMCLSKNQDTVNFRESSSWSFTTGEVFGFVKCAFKVVDGWESTPEDDVEEVDEGDENDDAEEGDGLGLDEVVLTKAEKQPAEIQGEDIMKLKTSYGHDHTLDEFAFSEDTLFKKFHDGESVPPRIRVRLYFVKAVCIHYSSTGLADPYIEVSLGREHVISMRNMAQMQTNTPDFHRIEARDVSLPEDWRLEVTIKSLEELALQDSVIGGTVIDLEDRWHSSLWQSGNRKQMLPTENRSLHSPEFPGRNRGSLEMWVEMIESSDAAAVKPSTLSKPPTTELEVRLVIWTASGVKLMSGDSTNVQIHTQLDCKEYGGEYDALQQTDVHFNSVDGKAVFNWRMVYPRIKMPSWSCTMTVSLHHHELMGDTFLGSFDLDLGKYLERVARDSDALTIGPSDITFYDGEQEDVGSVNMTMYVLTQAEAQGRRVGIAREEPNEDPQLLTPTEGRDWGTYLSALGLAWPDFGLWKKFIPVFVAMIVFLVLVIILRQIGLF
ncbi:OTOF [Symbiodinium sp. CCMP2592]|nr:OTOF [Symbiodinium sp. CCMP2592]